MPLARRAALLLLAGALHSDPAAAQGQLALAAGWASATLEQEFAGRDRAVDRQTGLVAGISARYPLRDGVSLTTDLLYVTKGGDDPGSDATLRFRYVSLPVMLRYDLDHQRAAAPFVAAGATAGYLAGCTLDNGTGHRESCDDAYGPEAAFSRIDLGLTLAAGIRLGHLELAVRREIGLRDIDRAPGFASRNRAWLVTVALGL